MRWMSRLTLLACVSLTSLVLVLSAYAQAPATQPAAPAGQATASAAALDRAVLIITIDGLRPDAALRANMPNLRKLMAEGSFTFWARTTNQAITLPSHTSMVTGVTVEKHGITWNSEKDAKPI